MKYKIKRARGNTSFRALGSAFFVLCTVAVCVYLSCTGFANKYTDSNFSENRGNEAELLTLSEIPDFYSDNITSDNEYELCKKSFNLRFPCDESYSSLTTYLVKGRIYLPEALVKEKLDASFESSVREQNGIYSVCRVDGTVYVNLNYVTECTGIFPFFFSDNKNIDIVYFDRSTIYHDITASEADAKKSAYIRLEDICPSGPSSERYSDNGLAKLRMMSDYLSENHQKFYIALIMWYKNPEKGIDNNLTENVDLYNASFIYTIDYMRANGGSIVLHGLTHQFENSVSADGDEYGKTGPYSSDDACRRRMEETIATAQKLGWESTAFEFPHYTATAKQLKIAEEYFDIVYQQKQPSKKPGLIEIVSKGKRKVAYIPTPADYVQSVYDKDGIVQRLTASAQNGQEVSLFFHPSLDFNLIFYGVSDTRQLTVNYDNGAILRTVIRTISNAGYSFKLFAQNIK